MITDADIKKIKSALTPEFNQLNTKIDNLKTRLDTLEDNVTGEIAKLHDENLITSNYRRDVEERIGVVEAKLAITQ